MDADGRRLWNRNGISFSTHQPVSRERRILQFSSSSYRGVYLSCIALAKQDLRLLLFLDCMVPAKPEPCSSERNVTADARRGTQI